MNEDAIMAELPRCLASKVLSFSFRLSVCPYADFVCLFTSLHTCYASYIKNPLFCSCSRSHLSFLSAKVVHEVVTSLLLKTDELRTLSKDMLGVLSQQLTRLIFSPNDVVVAKGSVVSGFYVVSMGHVAVQVSDLHLHLQPVRHGARSFSRTPFLISSGRRGVADAVPGRDSRLRQPQLRGRSRYCRQELLRASVYIV